MSALLELAARVEAASGADRELDEAIMGLLFLRRTRFIGVRYTDGRRSMSKVWVDPATGKWVSTHARKFTGSLDAAVSLVPEDWIVANCGQGDDRSWWAELRKGHRTSYSAVSHPNLKCASAAIALTAACLRALARGTS